MRIASIVRILVLLVAVYLGNCSIEESCDSGISSQSTLTGEPRVVKVTNAYKDKIVALYWFGQNNNEADTLISDLRPNETAEINTFSGHLFYAKTREGELLLPDRFVIKENEDSYTVGLPAHPTPVKGETAAVTRSLPPYSGVAGVSSTGHREAPQYELNIEKRSRPHPQVEIIGHRSTSMAAMFRCLCKNNVDYYWDDGAEGLYQGSLTLGKETTTNTYEGHVFFFTEKGNKEKELARFTMEPDHFMYVIKCEDAPKYLLDQTARDEAFRAEYLNRTGIQWRHFYGPAGPRAPPKLHMWTASEVGDVHGIVTHEGKWSCSGAADKCQSQEPVSLQLEAISLAPKAFIIDDFLSEFEAEEIKNIAKPRVKESTVGNNDAGGARRDKTRTSFNTWLNRETSPIIESIYRRAADLLKLEERQMSSHENSEEMQVVHYVNGQKYDNHHDWGVSGSPESRYITLLLYLSEPEIGGETAFPKGADGQGVQIKPKKGMAALFYNLLEDGNGDDLSLHAALPVFKGEKWLANFWVWDPHRK